MKLATLLLLVVGVSLSSKLTDGLSIKKRQVDDRPSITHLDITSHVQNRYATTQIRCRIGNNGERAQDTAYFIVVPKNAFISSFLMESDGKNVTAVIEEREKAKKAYQDAKQNNQVVGYLGVTVRHSDMFVVNVNVPKRSEIVLYLTYEELLIRKDGLYELVVNMHPKQVVDHVNVEIKIEESQKLAFVKIPPIRSGNDITDNGLTVDADIQRPDDKSAIIKFSPTVKEQKQIAASLNQNEDFGFLGQFIVQYDVEREKYNGGEILVNNGYFVHFFAPSELSNLNKHVVFILDTSGSMNGQKIQQLKIAMNHIIDELQPNDYFNLVQFSGSIQVWNLNRPSSSTRLNYWKRPYNLNRYSFPPAFPVTAYTKNKAKEAVNNFQAYGMTNIYDALRVGLHLVELRKSRASSEGVQPLIVFLTDGLPNVEKEDLDDITNSILMLNTAKVPILSLTFGKDADRDFSKKLSLKNYGTFQHIYDESDASKQFINFYNKISLPLLKNLEFKYDAGSQTTQSKFPLYFKGSEMVVAGKSNGQATLKDVSLVDAVSKQGIRHFRPEVKKTTTNLERLWAFMNVKQYLDESLIKNAKSNEQKALDLALKYSFVTDLTSFIVTGRKDVEFSFEVKPADDDNNAVLFSLRGAFGDDDDDGSTVAEEAPPPKDEDSTLLGIFSTESMTLKNVSLPLKIQTKMPWLKDEINQDGTLKFLEGNFVFDFNATSPENEVCINPKSEEGFCKLLQDCSEIYNTLTSPQSFQDYFCTIDDRLIGVCCSKK